MKYIKFLVLVLGFCFSACSFGLGISTISEGRANGIFEKVKADESYFRSKVKNICCFRAHRIAEFFYEDEGVIFGRISTLPNGSERFTYSSESGLFHTALVVYVRKSDSTLELQVLDSRYFKRMVSVEEWLQILFISRPQKPYKREEITEVRCDRAGRPPRLETLDRSIKVIYFFHDQSCLFSQRAIKEINFSKEGNRDSSGLFNTFAKKGTALKYREIGIVSAS